MTTAQKVLLGRQNMYQWDGVSTKTFSQRSASGGTLILNKLGYRVDVLTMYGDGSDYSDTAITKAMNKVGAVNDIGLTLNPGIWSINNDITLTSNIILNCPPGVDISVASGKTLTVNGYLEIGPYKVFSGSGTVTVNNCPVNALWFAGATLAVQITTALATGASVEVRYY